jgi:hypothetical protein
VNDVVKDEFKFCSMLTLSGNVSFHCNNCDIVITFNGNEYSSKFLMLNYILLVHKRRAEYSVVYSVRQKYVDMSRVAMSRVPSLCKTEYSSAILLLLNPNCFMIGFI